jgi:hypothetical protein
LTAEFKHGFEPLTELFDNQHRDIEYKEEWMEGVADRLRSLRGVDNSV